MMTKHDLIRAAAKAAKVTQETAAAVIQGAIDAATETLAAGEPVKLYDFGTFTAKRRKESTVYNFATGEKMQHPAMTIVTFSAATALKRNLNGKSGNSTEGGQKHEGGDEAE